MSELRITLGGKELRVAEGLRAGDAVAQQHRRPESTGFPGDRPTSLLPRAYFGWKALSGSLGFMH